MANTAIPKSFYQVYECQDVNDPWSYNPDQVLWATGDLASAHSYAYEQWKKDESRAYTIIQPYDDACRGGYGPLTTYFGADQD